MPCHTLNQKEKLQKLHTLLSDIRYLIYQEREVLDKNNNRKYIKFNN